MDLITFGEKYGWLVAIGMYSLKWFFDKGWPWLVKYLNKSQDSAIKAQEAEIKAETDARERIRIREDNDRADRRKRDDEDRQWNRQMMERLVKATEDSAKAQVEFNLRLALMQRLAETTNEGVTTLLVRSDYKISNGNGGGSTPTAVVSPKIGDD